MLWRAHLERSKEAAARARARRDREDEEWEAEVNQFGEPEARRRRLEEIEVNKELDKLTTSNFEEDEAEDLVSDPMLTVHARLRVNGRVIWTSSLGSKKRSVSAYGISNRHWRLRLRKGTGILKDRRRPPSSSLLRPFIVGPGMSIKPLIIILRLNGKRL